MKSPAVSAEGVGMLLRNFKAYFGSLSSKLKSELDVLDDLKKVKQDLNQK